MSVSRVHIKDLVHDKRNARRHNPRNIGMIEQSLQDSGFGRSLLVANDNTVLAGNATLDALSQIGMEEALVVESDGTRPIIIRRTDLASDDPRAVALSLADNRAAELAEWDLGALEQIKIDFPDAIDATFLPEELDALLGPQAAAQAVREPSELPAPPEPISTPNCVWKLGRHTLVCGDSTKPHSWDLLDRHAGIGPGECARVRLLATDPPFNYNVAVGSKDYKDPNFRAGGREDRTIANDNIPIPDYLDMLVRVFAECDHRLMPGGAFYVFGPSSNESGLAFQQAVWQYWPIKQTIVWVKQHFSFGPSDYHWRHEIIWYGWKQGAAHLQVSDRGQSTVWEVSRPTQSTDMAHPTRKPVELISLIVANGSMPGEIVLDPFAGAGSTLLACEQLGRTAACIELEPQYCDLIVDNWGELSDQEAILVHEEAEAER